MADYSLTLRHLLGRSVILIVFGLFPGVCLLPGTLGQTIKPGAAPALSVGSREARISLEVFNDYQCPPCAMLNERLRKLEAKYPADVRIIFRNFPLVQTHENALAAAQAVEAAGLQGKFSEMMNLIFDERDSWVESEEAERLFQTFAQRLGLDSERFAADYRGEEVRKRIRLDVERANSLEVQGTPTVFLNGAMLRLEKLLDLEQLIEAALNKTN